jgi:excisionase family DNA binding protein
MIDDLAKRMNRSKVDNLMTGESRYVSTAQVARALGVSVTTVKRWVDEGVLPAHRTAGGHRKLLLHDVLRMVRERNLPLVDMSWLVRKGATRSAEPDQVLEGLVAAVQDRDAEMIRSVICGAYQAGMPIEVLADRVLSPALCQVGHEWEAGRLEVMHEHQVSQACVAALYELRNLIRANAAANRPVAVGGAPEDDHSSLPSLMAELTLLDLGWDAVNIGPHTPVAAFRSAMNEYAPRLVWVSATHLADPERFLAGYQEVFRYAQARGIAVAVGGRGLTESVRVRMTYTTYGDGMAQLAAFARSLHSLPRRSGRGRPLGGTSSEK